MKRIEKEFYGRLGDWLETKRMSLNVSQNKTAQSVNHTYVAVQKYENGEVRIPLLTFIKICKFLKISWVEGVEAALSSKKKPEKPA